MKSKELCRETEMVVMINVILSELYLRKMFTMKKRGREKQVGERRKSSIF